MKTGIPLRNSKINLKNLSIVLILVFWIISLMISRNFLFGFLIILSMTLITIITLKTYDSFKRETIKIPRIKYPEKEFKLMIGFFIAYFLLQWPITLFLKTNSFPLINGYNDFIFDGYATIIKAIITLIIPTIWIWKNNYLSEVGFTRKSLQKSLIAIIPTSIIFFLLLNPVLLRYSIKWNFLVIAIVFSFFRAGLPEELIFRPLLQERIERVLDKWSAIFISSFIFAFLHLPGLYLLSGSQGGMNAGILRIISRLGLFHFTVGILFAYLWTETKNLTGNIVLHTWIDILSIYHLLITSI